jgi:hypothetical protein
MGQSTYAPGAQAVVNVQVTLNGQPVAAAQVTVTYSFGKTTAKCTATTDASGAASCFVSVPNLPNGTQVLVQVQVAGPNGEAASTTTSFTVRQTGS